MYRHILTAYDGSKLSDRAVGEAIEFAKQTGSKISLLFVLTPHHLLIGGGRPAPGLHQLEQQHMATLRQQASEMLKRAEERIKAAGVQCEVLLEDGNQPHERIVETAKQLKCDLILMASQGRNAIEELLVGSQTLKVLSRSPVPVLVVR